MLKTTAQRRLAILLVVGAILLVSGIVMLSSSEVKCGGRTMTKGQICETTGSGSATRNSYDEQKRVDQQTAYLTVLAGVVVLLGGAAGLVLNARRTSRPPA